MMGGARIGPGIIPAGGMGPGIIPAGGMGPGIIPAGGIGAMGTIGPPAIGMPQQHGIGGRQQGEPANGKQPSQYSVPHSTGLKAL